MVLQNQKLLNSLTKSKFIRDLFLMLFVSAFSSMLSMSCLAEYKPPKDQEPPKKHTTSTATRGGRCYEQAVEIPLTLLAPYTHVGQTSSPYPLLAWYVSETDSVPMKLSIYETDDNQKPKLLYDLKLQMTSGIMTVSLPKNQPGLKIGKRYTWEVEIICSRKLPAHNIVATAEIEVVTVPSEILWYDTIKYSLNKTKNGRLSYKTVALLKTLANLEQQFGQQYVIHAKRLIDIASLAEQILVKEAKIIKEASK